jgi:hypothetical protein
MQYQELVDHIETILEKYEDDCDEYDRIWYLYRQLSYVGALEGRKQFGPARKIQIECCMLRAFSKFKTNPAIEIERSIATGLCLDGWSIITDYNQIFGE